MTTKISRSQQVLAYFEQHPTRYFCLADIRANVLPNTKISDISSTVNGLVHQGLLNKKGARRGCTYKANPKGIAIKNEKLAARRAPAESPKQKPAAPKKHKGPERPPVLQLRRHHPDQHSLNRAQIAHDVQAFLRAGGKIQRLAPGASSKHFDD